MIHSQADWHSFLFNAFRFPYGKEQSRYDESGYCRDIAYDGGQSETIAGDEQEREADRRHEHSRQEGNPIILLLAYQVDRQGPKREYRQGLVCPAEIVPYHVESVFVGDVIPQQCQGDSEYGDADIDALTDGVLLQMQELGDDEPRAPQGSVSAGNRGGYYSQYRQSPAECSQPAL